MCIGRSVKTNCPCGEQRAAANLHSTHGQREFYGFLRTLDTGLPEICIVPMGSEATAVSYAKQLPGYRKSRIRTISKRYQKNPKPATAVVGRENTTVPASVSGPAFLRIAPIISDFCSAADTMSSTSFSLARVML